MIDIILHKKNRFTWAFLAFQAGLVNIGGFFALNVYVSHTTGFSSLFSLSVLKGEFSKAFYFLSVPLFFILGAFFSATFTEIRRLKKHSPIYTHVMVLLSIIYLFVAVSGDLNFFGEFGKHVDSFGDFILLSLLSFSCGSQNGLFTTYSNSVIRTTHLTGLMTDLGIGLAKAIIVKDRKEKGVNSLRILLILSFFSGAFFGALLFPRYDFIAFLVPSILSLIIALRLYITRVYGFGIF